jgi:response regulator RpfG family c-di-GMP phosphodiesterase
MMDKVLFVDDEPNVLSAYQRELRKQFDVETALGAEEGLKAVGTRGPFAVVVSDFRMPRIDGNRFLTVVKKVAPDTVRMILTGYADVNTAINAVNEGNIFRFLTKPCAADVLTKALQAGIEQYRLITAERELLEKTLRGSIEVLTELLALVNPEAFGRCSRIKNCVMKIAGQMELPDLWQLETAAMLSQIGCVIFPEGVFQKLVANQEFSRGDAQAFSMHPGIGSSLISNIPRMEMIADIVEYQEKHFDGMGFPLDSRKGSDIPVGARLLKVALDFDVLETRGVSKIEATKTLKQRQGWYDPEVLAALESVLGIATKVEFRLIRLGQLEVGMVLEEDLHSEPGLVLIARGQKVSLAILERLRQFGRTSLVRQPFRVMVPSAE